MSRRYCAFISYRHADNTQEGRRWAEWLHQALEHYVVPPDLGDPLKLRGEPIRESLYPIFRDQDELPAHADLATGIRAALEASDFLIVLCSPRSAVSPWVRKEVREFKELGRSDRILAVIIAGEPNADDPAKAREGIMRDEECFCEELRFGVARADGTLDWSARTEPLAADLRPNGMRAEGFVTAEAYREHLTQTSSHGPERIATLSEKYRQQLNQGLLKVIAGLLGVPLGQLINRDAAHRAAQAEKEAERQREIAERERLLAEEARKSEAEARAAENVARQTARRLAVVGAVTLLLAMVAGGFWWHARKLKNDLVDTLKLFKGNAEESAVAKLQQKQTASTFEKYGITPATPKAAGNWLLDDLKLIPITASDSEIAEHIKTMQSRMGVEYLYIQAALEYHSAARLYEKKDLPGAAAKIELSSKLCLKASEDAPNAEMQRGWRDDSIRMLYRAGLICSEAKDFSRAIQLMDRAIAATPSYAALLPTPKEALAEEHSKLRIYYAAKAVLVLQEAKAAGGDPGQAKLQMEALLKDAESSVLAAIENAGPKNKGEANNPRCNAAIAISSKLKDYSLAAQVFEDGLKTAANVKAFESKIGVSAEEAELHHLRRATNIRFGMASNYAMQPDPLKAAEQLRLASQLSEQHAKLRSADASARLEVIESLSAEIESNIGTVEAIYNALGFDAAAAKALLDYLLNTQARVRSAQAQCLTLLGSESHAKSEHRFREDSSSLRFVYKIDTLGLKIAAVRDLCLQKQASGLILDAELAKKLESLKQIIPETFTLGFEIGAAIPENEDAYIDQEKMFHLAYSHDMLGSFKEQTSEKIKHWAMSIKFWRMHQDVAKARLPQGGDLIAWSLSYEGTMMVKIAQLPWPALLPSSDNLEDPDMMREIFASGKMELWRGALVKLRESSNYTPQDGTVMRSAYLAYYLGEYFKAAGDSIPMTEQLALIKEARDKRRLVLSEWIQKQSESAANAGPNTERLVNFAQDSNTYLNLLWKSDPEQAATVAEDGKQLADEFCKLVTDFKHFEEKGKAELYATSWLGVSTLLSNWVHADVARKAPAHSIEECLKALESAAEFQKMARKHQGSNFNLSELKKITILWLDLAESKTYEERRVKEGCSKTSLEIKEWKDLRDSPSK